MSHSRISYVNGRYLRHDHAGIHVEDRGNQFADGVYEVIALENKHTIDENLHLNRLLKSLDGLSIELPVSVEVLDIIIKEVIRRNSVTRGYVYIQISRGQAKRNHIFPEETKASIIITVNSPRPQKQEDYENGISVITTPDIRWKKRNIKSLALIANVMVKQEAHLQHAKEAWMIDEKGFVTEGSTSNCFIVTKDGTIRTHPEGEGILGGMTRKVVIELAKANGIKVEEKAFSIKDVEKAVEAFATSTTIRIMPVTSIDGKKIGNGKPGEITLRLIEVHNNRIRHLAA